MPVMKWENFRLILAIGAWLDLTICQFDMKLAYLHGTMKEEVWVWQLEGFEVPGKEHLPMQLQKALYGKKHRGYKWNRTLYRFIEVEQGWTGCSYNRVAFYRCWDDGTWVLVGFWVDNATAVGDEVHVLELEDAI
jgi:hypothetical protein